MIGQKPISPGRVAWNKFRRNPLAMIGSVVILLICLVSMMGHLIRPDKTIHANDQHLNIALQKPGFSVDMIRIKKTEYTEVGFLQSWMEGGRPNEYESVAIEKYVIRNDSIFVTLFDAAPTEQSQAFAFHQLIENKKENNSGNYIFNQRYWLGTDKYGRDLLSRLMAGSFISLAVGFIAVLISLLVGLSIGLLAGYFRGWVDSLLMWFTNVVWSVPTLIMVMAITLIFGSGFWKVFLAVGLTMWVEVARISRGQVLGIREKEYIEAARALGYREGRIIFRHILPNIMGPVIVISAANFASAILIEAGLSFMGLGAQIPTPSWGNMIKEHYSFITTDMAYLAIIPGLCIMALVLAFMMVGSGLRDALDTRIK